MTREVVHVLKYKFKICNNYIKITFWSRRTRLLTKSRVSITVWKTCIPTIIYASHRIRYHGRYLYGNCTLWWHKISTLIHGLLVFYRLCYKKNTEHSPRVPIWLNLIWIDLIWFGLIWFGLVRIASHRIASHRIASHRIASHRIESHRIASHRIASHRIASHSILNCILFFL